MSTDRILLKLKARPTYEHLGDDLLTQVIEEAIEDFLVYTNRVSLPEGRSDSIIIEIASIKLNMLGAEGTTAASEGDVSRTWSALPQDVRDRMDSMRFPCGPRR